MIDVLILKYTLPHFLSSSDSCLCLFTLHLLLLRLQSFCLPLVQPSLLCLLLLNAPRMATFWFWRGGTWRFRTRHRN
jgi:hypothetical protein